MREGDALPRYVVPVLLAAGLLAAGCGPTERPGPDETTQAETTTAVPILNVCDDKDLPASVLTAAGLDPATKDVITDAPTGETSWRVCAWDPVGVYPVTYLVELYSTSHTLAETRNNPNLTDFADTTIGGREAITFMEKSDTDSSRCRAAFGAEQGSFILSTGWLGTGDKPQDLCGLAVQYLSKLEPHLPG